jgi:ribosome maturation factor RimP
MTNIDLDLIYRRVKEIVENGRMRLYDIAFNDVSRTLKVFIDKAEGGVTIKDCETMSSLISHGLDDLDAVNFNYTLEVSSPGIERPLLRPEHYEWARGKFVEIVTKNARIRGFIRDTTPQGVVVAAGGGETAVPYDTVTKARVVQET